MVTLDYRGRGRSDYDPDYQNYNVLREGHDVLELLDHLSLDKVTVLGTSRGGLIAMALAGLAAVVAGGHFLVDGAVALGLARAGAHVVSEMEGGGHVRSGLRC